jgi:hypothetical protein
MLARHFVHRAQHRLVADATAAQRELKLHPLNIVGGFGGHVILAFINLAAGAIMAQCGFQPKPVFGKRPSHGAKKSDTGREPFTAIDV